MRIGFYAAFYMHLQVRFTLNCLLKGASPRGAHESATNMAARQPASSESCRFERLIVHSLCLFKLVSPSPKAYIS